jgi:hypothetical protein
MHRNSIPQFGDIRSTKLVDVQAEEKASISSQIFDRKMKEISRIVEVDLATPL